MVSGGNFGNRGKRLSTGILNDYKCSNNFSDLLDHVAYDTIGLSWTMVICEFTLAIYFKSAGRPCLCLKGEDAKKKHTGNPERRFLDRDLLRRHSQPWPA